MATWVLAALCSALCAGLTAILSKCGIRHTDSDVATAIRTVVVLACAWLVAVVTVPDVPAALAAITPRSYAFLALSGVATGASWLLYYYAVQMGQVSVVVQLDKLSILVSIAFSWLVFHEHLSRRAVVGLVLIVAGAAVMAALA